MVFTVPLLKVSAVLNDIASHDSSEAINALALTKDVGQGEAARRLHIAHTLSRWQNGPLAL